MLTTTTIKAWDNFLLPVLGEVECHVRYRSCDVKALLFIVDVHNMKPFLSLSLSRDLNLISELVTTNMPASTSTLTCSLSNLQSSSNGNLSPLVEQNINHMKSNCTSCTQNIVSEFAKKGLYRHWLY